MITAFAVFKPLAIIIFLPHQLERSFSDPYMGSFNATMCMLLSISCPQAPAFHVSTSYHVAIPEKADLLPNKIFEEFTTLDSITSGSRYALTALSTVRNVSNHVPLIKIIVTVPYRRWDPMCLSTTPCPCPTSMPRIRVLCNSMRANNSANGRAHQAGTPHVRMQPLQINLPYPFLVRFAECVDQSKARKTLQNKSTYKCSSYGFLIGCNPAIFFNARSPTRQHT
mgnify:CR=1 FL=1